MNVCVNFECVFEDRRSLIEFFLGGDRFFLFFLLVYWLIAGYICGSSCVGIEYCRTFTFGIM